MAPRGDWQNTDVSFRGPHAVQIKSNQIKFISLQHSTCPSDNPSVFALELVTLARRAFTDVNASVRLQLVRDRYIAGQAECSLCRHLDSVGPDTPMQDIVDNAACGRVMPRTQTLGEVARSWDILGRVTRW